MYINTCTVQAMDTVLMSKHSVLQGKKRTLQIHINLPYYMYMYHAPPTIHFQPRKAYNCGSVAKQLDKMVTYYFGNQVTVGMMIFCYILYMKMATTVSMDTYNCH